MSLNAGLDIVICYRKSILWSNAEVAIEWTPEVGILESSVVCRIVHSVLRIEEESTEELSLKFDKGSSGIHTGVVAVRERTIFC